MALDITVNVNSTGEFATSNTHEGTTMPWVGSFETGKTVDGVPYVVVPSGTIQLQEPAPAFTTAGRGARNGSQINPINMGGGGSGVLQPFDIGVPGDYSATPAANFSASYGPGDVLAKTEGVTTIVTNRDGIIAKWSGLHIVATAPAATAFAAPFVWPVADKATRPWRTVDIDARLAELPSYSTSGQATTTWAALQPYFDNFDLGRALTLRTSGGYEAFTRYGSSAGVPGDNLNYGRYLNGVQAHVLIGLMSDAWSSANKRAALIRLLQHGCQFGETLVKGGVALVPDGGHDVGLYIASMAWLWATGRQAQYSTWLPLVGGNTTGQYYRITASNLANDFVPHSDPLKPYAYRRRNTVSGAGTTTVVVEGFAPSSGLTGDTAGNLDLSGLDLVKESGGASAQITASSQSGGSPGTVTLTLAAPISGHVNGDTVYCRARYTLTDGMAEWRLRDALNLSNPSPNAPYRNLNYPCAARMFARVIGMAGSDVLVGEDYLERAMAGTNGMPGQADNNPVGAATPRWVQQFYSAHWSTIKALPQDV